MGEAQVVQLFEPEKLSCNKCKEEKPISEFTKRKDRMRGYEYCCKECFRASRRLLYSKVVISENEKFTCKQCEKTKPAIDFHKKPSGKFGLTRKCKECMLPQRREANNRFWKKNGGRDGYKTDTWGFKKHYYGITKEQFFEMLSAQGGACAICRVIPEGVVSNVFHIDHCHETGKVRGLLCMHCNHGLGKFKDNITVLQNALRYLQERGSYGKA